MRPTTKDTHGHHDPTETHVLRCYRVSQEDYGSISVLNGSLPFDDDKCKNDISSRKCVCV